MRREGSERERAVNRIYKNPLELQQQIVIVVAFNKNHHYDHQNGCDAANLSCLETQR